MRCKICNYKKYNSVAYFHLSFFQSTDIIKSETSWQRKKGEKERLDLARLEETIVKKSVRKVVG